MLPPQPSYTEQMRAVEFDELEERGGVATLEDAEFRAVAEIVFELETTVFDVTPLEVEREERNPVTFDLVFSCARRHL
jgi:hypothetical protein